MGNRSRSPARGRAARRCRATAHSRSFRLPGRLAESDSGRCFSEPVLRATSVRPRRAGRSNRRFPGPNARNAALCWHAPRFRLACLRRRRCRLLAGRRAAADSGIPGKNMSDRSPRRRAESRLRCGKSASAARQPARRIRRWIADRRRHGNTPVRYRLASSSRSAIRRPRLATPKRRAEPAVR
ncbi:MAG: hypothetical protein BWZ10_03170 [candidate division BRC1 bacterium ADurb.BinA364]|nr:MAG: hypothetical protein BWZ10_03170 [candidate division BRC1 bacterium ADurb.BinA364]